MKQNLLCVDFLNILYRSFYALTQIRTSEGIPTGALYGCIRILKKVIKKHAIQKIIICNDGSSLIKKKKYNFYKANRESTPKELLIQKEILLEYFQAIKIPVVSMPGYEADDIINYICHQNIINSEENIFILSSDKDLHPLLLLKNTRIIDSNKDTLLDQDWVYKYYQNNFVTAEKLFLYLTLTGDTSDNIPGVKGIGPKTALRIINEYDSLDIIYKNIEKGNQIISKKITSFFIENKTIAYQSLFLIKPEKIPFNNDIDILLKNEKPWSYHNFTRGNLILKKYECTSLIEEDKDALNDEKLLTNYDTHLENFENKESIPFAKNLFEKKIAIDKESLQILLQEIQQAKYIAIDTETTSGDPRTTTIIGYSIATTAAHAWYIPLMYLGKKTSLFNTATEILNDIPQETVVIMHNAIFDLHVLKTIGINIKAHIFDTMITAFILKENKIGLKELSLKLLHQKMDSFFDVTILKRVKQFDEIELNEATDYAATDARQTLLLYQYFIKKLRDTNMEGIYELLHNIEMPLIKVLFNIESHGIYCNKEVLKKEESKYLSSIEKIHKEIRDMAMKHNYSLNPMSNKQTGEFLYKILNIPHTGKKFATDHLTLSTIQHFHPIIPLIILYRSIQSNISHFTTGLLKYIENGKIHTHYQQYITNTGRITTINPNLQNIPKTNDFFKIRSAFHSPEKKYLVSFDYSQIEIRVLANISNDPYLIELLVKNKDIHNDTATKIFKKNIEEISHEERQIAKKINFSVIYGQGAYNLSRELKISLSEAKNYLSIFEETYQGIFIWKKKIIEDASQKGYVTTLHGLRRNIPELYDSNKTIFKLGSRIAINTIIQGTAAEIMKKAMIQVHNYLSKTQSGKIVLQIHDEILVELDEKNTDIHIAQITSIMEHIEESKVTYSISIKKDTVWN